MLAVMDSAMDLDPEDLTAQISDTRKALESYNKANKARKKQLGGQHSFCGSGQFHSLTLTPASAFRSQARP